MYGCSSCGTGQLGAISTIFTAATGVNQVASLLGLNSSDPVKDQERINRINQAYDQAMRGDQAAVSCLREMAQGVANNDGRTCAVGSQLAYRFAQTKWTEYQARHAAGGAGTWLVGQSDLPSQAVGWLSSSWVIGAVVVGGYLLLRRRR